MRGEYCVYGATVLSAISALMLVFANISQLSSAPLVSGLYFAQMNVQGLSAAYDAAAGGSGGVFGGNANQMLGSGNGLRWYYRYGVYRGCGYNDQGGVCNGTMFGYPFQPYGNILADIPEADGKRDAARNLIGTNNGVYDANYNQVVSRVGNLFIFVGTVACGVALVVGVLRSRVTFLVASICSGLSALLLMSGAAMWTAIIARDSPISKQMINDNVSLGIVITAGPAMYLTWVAFVVQTLSAIPYVISFMTFRRNSSKNFS